MSDIIVMLHQMVTSSCASFNSDCHECILIWAVIVKSGLPTMDCRLWTTD